MTITADKHLYIMYMYTKSNAIDFIALLECNT